MADIQRDYAGPYDTDVKVTYDRRQRCFRVKSTKSGSLLALCRRVLLAKPQFVVESKKRDKVLETKKAQTHVYVVGQALRMGSDAEQLTYYDAYHIGYKLYGYDLPSFLAKKFGDMGWPVSEAESCLMCCAGYDYSSTTINAKGPNLGRPGHEIESVRIGFPDSLSREDFLNQECALGALPY